MRLFTVSRIFEKIIKTFSWGPSLKKIHVSENSIDLNIILETNENGQYVYEYPNNLLQKEEIEESSSSMLQFKWLTQKN